MEGLVAFGYYRPTVVAFDYCRPIVAFGYGRPIVATLLPAVRNSQQTCTQSPQQKVTATPALHQVQEKNRFSASIFEDL